MRHCSSSSSSTCAPPQVKMCSLGPAVVAAFVVFCVCTNPTYLLAHLLTYLPTDSTNCQLNLTESDTTVSKSVSQSWWSLFPSLKTALAATATVKRTPSWGTLIVGEHRSNVNLTYFTTISQLTASFFFFDEMATDMSSSCDPCQTPPVEPAAHPSEKILIND